MKINQAVMAARGFTCICVQPRFFTFMLKILIYKTDPLGNVLDPRLGTMVHGYKSSCAGIYIVLHTQLALGGRKAVSTLLNE